MNTTAHPTDLSHTPAAQAPVALVTGGTGGIGRAICSQLANEGHRVVFTYRSNPEDAEALAAECSTLHPARAVRVDLSDPEATRAAVAEVAEREGRLDVVVYASGPHVPMRHLSRVTPQDMTRQLNDDTAVFFSLVHAALPFLRTSRGNVVAVTSAATVRFPKRDGLSSAPKAAVEALVRGFAAEEGRYGVRFNCVGPGMLSDGMAARLMANGDLDDEALAITRQNIPMRTFGTARDISEAVCFLASPRAGFISGQKLDVDGGYGV